MALCCRPLTDEEIDRVRASLDRTRDRALFVLGIRTGFRIAELCKVKVSDVWQYGKPKSHLLVSKSKMKGKKASRSVPLHVDAQNEISKLILELALGPNEYLFQSRKGANSPLSTCQAWRILKSVYAELQLDGPLATHSMRKTFAHKVFENSGNDLRVAQRALGHKSIDNTVKYLQIENDSVEDSILSVK